MRDDEDIKTSGTGTEPQERRRVLRIGGNTVPSSRSRLKSAVIVIMIISSAGAVVVGMFHCTPYDYDPNRHSIIVAAKVAVDYWWSCWLAQEGGGGERAIMRPSG